MLGDQLEIGRVGSLAGVVQQRGGALMQLTGFKRGQRVVYGRTEKRLGVDEGRVIAQDAGAHQRIGCGPRLALIDCGQRSGLGERGIAQYGDGVREPPHVLRMSPQACDHVAAHRFGGNSFDRLAAARLRRQVA